MLSERLCHLFCQCGVHLHLEMNSDRLSSDSVRRVILLQDSRRSLLFLRKGDTQSRGSLSGHGNGHPVLSAVDRVAKPCLRRFWFPLTGSGSGMSQLASVQSQAPAARTPGVHRRVRIGTCLVISKRASGFAMVSVAERIPNRRPTVGALAPAA